MRFFFPVQVGAQPKEYSAELMMEQKVCDRLNGIIYANQNESGLQIGSDCSKQLLLWCVPAAL